MHSSRINRTRTFLPFFAGLAFVLGCDAEPGAGTFDEQQTIEAARTEPLDLVGLAPSAVVVEVDDGVRIAPPERDDEANSTPPILAPAAAAPLSALGARLSRDPSWLSATVREALGRRKVDLDELFADAPSLVEHGGRAYRLIVEGRGDWDDRATEAGRIAVVLNHEVLIPDGAARTALGWLDGRERRFREAELTAPFVMLSLADLDPVEAAAVRAAAPPLADGIPLGTALAEAPLRRDVEAAQARDMIPRTGTCAAQAPSCGLSYLTCNAGYSPYFVLSSVRIQDEHEGAFSGGPEFEIYVLRMDATTPPGGGSAATTTAIFDGGTHLDARGRSRLLPDVQSTGKWYSVSGGFALLPFTLGTKLAAHGVEDDATKGVWKSDADWKTYVKIFSTAYSAVVHAKELDILQLVKDLKSLFDLLGDAFNDDDLYTPAYGVDKIFYRNEVCDKGRPYNTTFTFGTTADDWLMQGYFACLPGPTLCP